MNALEQKLAEEAARLKKWREGGHFHLQSFNMPRAECGRCKEWKPHIFVLTVNPPVSWGADFEASAPVPLHENVCRDCLTESEIAGLLLPALHFVMTKLLRDWQTEKNADSDLIGSLHYVQSYLACRQSILQRPERELKEFALRALEGLKGVPVPEMDWIGLQKELEAVLSKDIYIAAHPDDIPTSTEQVDAWRSRIKSFFRNGGSTEMYALRDAIAQCVEIFRRYFVRRAV